MRAFNTKFFLTQLDLEGDDLKKVHPCRVGWFGWVCCLSIDLHLMAGPPCVPGWGGRHLTPQPAIKTRQIQQMIQKTLPDEEQQEYISRLIVINVLRCSVVFTGLTGLLVAGTNIPRIKAPRSGPLTSPMTVKEPCRVEVKESWCWANPLKPVD